MKRPTNSQLFERRREVAILTRNGWTQAAVARHLRIASSDRGTSGRGRTSARATISERGAHDVALKGRFVAPKYRLCATPGFTVKCYVSRVLAIVSGYFRAIPSDRKKLAESRTCCDTSAGPDTGSGDAMQLAMNSPTFEKLRMCAMRDR
jgi:hypothetical protein